MPPTEPLTGFQSRLLPELLDVVDAYRRDHDCAHTAGPAPVRRRHGHRWAWATLAVTVTVTAALAVGVNVQTPEAYAVDVMPSGLVKVTIDDIADFDQIDGLHKALRRHGVPTTLIETRAEGCPAGRLIGVSAAVDVAGPPLHEGGGISFLINPRIPSQDVNLLVTSDAESAVPMTKDTDGLPVAPSDFGSSNALGTGPVVGWLQIGCSTRSPHQRTGSSWPADPAPSRAIPATR
ncbi:hypothetical protein EV385_5331 [Krasilnikovia cinnamomea]|uniref:Uncharacterized protein n=1 Tax=Krasilnikovia cinnamomea TaxID=349313 RepID=A0A4Q7ZQM6_9ACTN|nr:hypothetical protein [Krasilnikovia cinnamomea]RZU53407.1 hypothetical protein EV385_5331 [Krasilnikovia cinnamomea]